MNRAFIIGSKALRRYAVSSEVDRLALCFTAPRYLAPLRIANLRTTFPGLGANNKPAVAPATTPVINPENNAFAISQPPLINIPKYKGKVAKPTNLAGASANCKAWVGGLSVTALGGRGEVGVVQSIAQ